jgi:hypothetical protein
MGIGGSSYDDCDRCCHIDIEEMKEENQKLKAQLAEFIDRRKEVSDLDYEVDTLKATLIRSLDALSHYANRMDSGGTARRAIKDIEEVLK